MAGSNIGNLNQFFRIIQPSDLLGKYDIVDLSKANNKVDSDKNNNFLGQLVGLFINTGENQGSAGILTLQEIVEKINYFQTQAKGEEKDLLHNFIRVFSQTKVRGSDDVYWKGKKGDALSWDTVLGSPQAGSKPKLGVIQSASPFVSQNVRDVNNIALFMNVIPTLELARAVPMLEVKFQFQRPKLEGRNELRVPSLLKFLNGATVPRNADEEMALALSDTQKAIDGSDQEVFKAGTELFVSPQTLINPSKLGTTARFAPVIDSFRPFMSIDSFEISATPKTGLFSFKTAKLILTLHDRSRLGEISDLVRPEVYTNTTLSISYGWSHPDKIDGGNSFGDLINRMKIQNEKYGIINCGFAFDQVGQCKITLELAAKGTQELRVINIADDKEYQNNIKKLNELSALIADLREKAGYARPEGLTKEVRAYQILDVAERGELVFDFKDKEVNDLINKLKKSKDGPNTQAAQQLADKLKDIFSKDKQKPGMVESLKKTIDSNIQKKFLLLQQGEDPFLDRDDSLVQKFNLESRDNRVCSLAKVFLTFVGGAYQSVENIDEIQFMFYQFNPNAGKLGSTNIGSFPVDISYLKKIFEEHAKSKGNPNMTVYEFVLLLQGAIINDPRAIGYGLREFYSPRVDTSKQPELIKGKEIEDILAKAVKNNGSFKWPVVEAYIETLAGRPVQQGETAADKIQHDIMRIHIYDKVASPYEPMMQLVRSQAGLQEIIKPDPKSSGFGKGTAGVEESVNLANQAGLNLKFDDKTRTLTVQSPTNVEDMKRFIAQVLPTITYGSNNTAVINANLQTQQNQLLSTVQMLRTAGRQNTTEPNGSGVGGIPLRTIPAQLDMNTFGCPLLNVNQQFFIDFKTGTTIDNIYLVYSLNHTIKQGKFESHLKFVPLDAYGVYESIIAKVDQVSAALKKLTPT